MKCVDEFSRFLVDEVNLNQTRIDTLASRVGTIETFLTNSTWKPRIRGFSPQGSWAHRTIIKPGDRQPVRRRPDRLRRSGPGLAPEPTTSSNCAPCSAARTAIAISPP